VLERAARFSGRPAEGEPWIVVERPRATGRMRPSLGPSSSLGRTTRFAHGNAPRVFLVTPGPVDHMAVNHEGRPPMTIGPVGGARLHQQLQAPVAAAKTEAGEGSRARPITTATPTTPRVRRPSRWTSRRDRCRPPSPLRAAADCLFPSRADRHPTADLDERTIEAETPQRLGGLQRRRPSGARVRPCRAARVSGLGERSLDLLASG